MAVLNSRRAENESHIKPLFADKPDDVVRPALNDLDVYVGMSITVPVQKIGKEAIGDRGMQSDTELTLFTARDHAGCLYGVVEMVDAYSHLFEEMASCLG